MEQLLYYLSKLLPYLVLFPILTLLLWLVLYLLCKKGIKNNNVVLYGLFCDIQKKEVLLISLLLVEYIIIIESIFFSDFWILSLLFIFTPIVLYAIISLDFINMIMNIIATVFLLVLCFFGRVFISYFIRVDALWYVLLIFISLIVLILLMNTYILVKNINNLIIKRKL